MTMGKEKVKLLRWIVISPGRPPRKGILRFIKNKSPTMKTMAPTAISTLPYPEGSNMTSTYKIQRLLLCHQGFVLVENIPHGPGHVHSFFCHPPGSPCAKTKKVVNSLRPGAELIHGGVGAALIRTDMRRAHTGRARRSRGRFDRSSL